MVLSVRWLVASHVAGALPFCWRKFLDWGCISHTVVVPYSLVGWGQSKLLLQQQPGSQLWVWLTGFKIS